MTTTSLNPFFFRARFPTTTTKKAAHLALRLNPFFFRARFPTPSFVDAIPTEQS